MRSAAWNCIRVLGLWMVTAVTGMGDNSEGVSTYSPSGELGIHLSLKNMDENGSGKVHYHVSFQGKQVILPSPLGMIINEGNVIGEKSSIVGIESRTVSDSFVQISGKRRNVAATATETTITIEESRGDSPWYRWKLQMRAYNDGVAFKYQFPEQSGWEIIEIQSELTSFQFPHESTATALPLNSFTSSYETRYQHRKVSELSPEWLMGLPIHVQTGNGVHIGLSEAHIHEYAGMYLSRTEGTMMRGRLSPLPGEEGVCVRYPMPHESPWRVFMVSDWIGDLIESDIILLLSEPCAIPDTGWIKTGKTTFPWWNGFYEEGVDFSPGLNTETAKYYIDFCADAGIPYHSLDGFHEAWYGGPIVPYEGSDPTTPIAGLDLAEVLSYAESKGVEIRVWMNWKAAEAHMERAFPLYEKWGIEGVMLDFMDRDDQEMNRFVRKAMALAARHHLTITLHGCPKPHGLERTYPNLLSHEGVMNLEYNKWDSVGILPEHELTVTYTRMLAGPLDFHQGSFRTVTPEQFKPRNGAPLNMGTPARTLAGYVIYQNHLSMVADYPSAYRHHPALKPLVQIPTTWDETSVIHAELNNELVLARKSGADWHIGIMTDSNARDIEVPLDALKLDPKAKYSAEIWHDDLSDTQKIHQRTEVVTPSDTIKIKVAPGGGSYIRVRAQ